MLLPVAAIGRSRRKKEDRKREEERKKEEENEEDREKERKREEENEEDREKEDKKKDGGKKKNYNASFIGGYPVPADGWPMYDAAYAGHGAYPGRMGRQPLLNVSS